MEYFIVITALVVVGYLVHRFYIQDTDYEIIKMIIVKPLFGKEYDLWKLINEHRVSLGLDPLTSDLTCYQVANAHTKWMSNALEVNHHLAFSRKKAIIDSGFDIYGEVVGYGFNDVRSLFNAYIRSEGHRKIIEHPKYRYVGVTIAHTDKTYNTIVFAG